MWDSPTAIQPQYNDVLYAPGFYNCYTLAVNLTSVCDASLNASFVASPNDPNATKCVCPPGAQCQDRPVVDLSTVSCVGPQIADLLRFICIWIHGLGVAVV